MKRCKSIPRARPVIILIYNKHNRVSKKSQTSARMPMKKKISDIIIMMSSFSTLIIIVCRAKRFSSVNNKL